jgi:hypothetical protein
MADTRNGHFTDSAGLPPMSGDDQQMDQIRDLLFGGLRTEVLSRITTLEQRVTTLEQALQDARRLEEGKRQTAFDNLGAAIGTLSAQIRTMAKS